METLASSPGASPSANGVAASHFATVDPALVVEHLAKLIEANLGATRRELEDVGSLLSKAKYHETLQRCSRFASESQVALYVQKELVETADEGNLEESEDQGE